VSVRSEIRAALIAGDVDLLRRMWGAWFPNSPQPKDWQEAQVQLHAARTAAESVPVKLRCFSHHWLVERGLASLLPDRLRPSADQYCPRVTPGVGFAWSSGSAVLRPAKAEIEAAVGARIEEMAADGLLTKDPDGVRDEMMFTKNRTLHALFGNFAALRQRKAPA
jgi:hypothetical protein